MILKRRRKTMAKYVLCPRCELNYIKEGEEYCDVCKAELKKGPQLVFAVDEEEEQETMILCPVCLQRYIKEGEQIKGNTVKVKIVKNKVAPPFKNCEVDLIYGEGFSKYGEVLDMALQFGLAKKSGSWFEVLGERVGQGKDAAKNFLKEYVEVYDNLYRQIEEKMNAQ